MTTTTTTTSPASDLVTEFATFIGSRMNDEILTALSRGATDQQAADAATAWLTEATAHLADNR